jgi:hypothetical protein
VANQLTGIMVAGGACGGAEEGSTEGENRGGSSGDTVASQLTHLRRRLGGGRCDRLPVDTCGRRALLSEELAHVRLEAGQCRRQRLAQRHLLPPREGQYRIRKWPVKLHLRTIRLKSLGVKNVILNGCQAETVVGLPWAADSCPSVEKLRTVLPLTVDIRDGAVHLVCERSVGGFHQCLVRKGYGISTACT